MSPTEAIASEVFRIYLILIAAILVVSGAVLVALRWGLRRDVGHAWKAYRGWLVIVPLVVGAIFLGRAATILFVTLVSIFGFKEYARATGLYRDWLMTTVVYLGIAAVGVVSFVHDPQLGRPGWYGLFAILPAYVIAAILLVPIVRNRSRGQLQTIALSLLGFLYIGWMLGHTCFLANANRAYGYLLYLIFAVELNDVAAFTFGKLFGRHPLRSNISPKKTWEGSLGALAVSLALPWLMRFSFPHFSALELVLTGLIVGIAGQLGDLSISVIKRDLGIKDMGAVLEGHGGLLDRVDSLIYVAPLFFHMVRWFHDLYEAHVTRGQDRHMEPWHYDTSEQLDKTIVERLRQFPREPDLLVFGLRSAGAVFIRAWLRTYHRLSIIGRDNLPHDGSYIIVANHASHLDTLAIVSALPLAKLHHVFPAAAKDFFFESLPRAALASILVNALPFDRQTHVRQSLSLCKAVLENRGNILVIYPEGTRSTTGEIGEFRPGISLLLAGSELPVVPCYLDGTFRAWPKGARFPRPRKVRLLIGQPRRYAALKRGKEAAEVICRDLREAVLALAQRNK